MIRQLLAMLTLGSITCGVRADDLPIRPPEPIKPIETVLINGGCYKMGDTFGDGAANEQAAHEVCVKDFLLGKFLVTQIQWAALMGSNPSKEPTCGVSCPVENVSWNEVQDFLRKLNQKSGKHYRLPSEAEWEYAARSGGKSEKWAGTNIPKELTDFAWYYNNSGYHSHPVGEKKPNGLGLYDMTGNVWEWMSDFFAEDYYATSPKDQPTGPEVGVRRSLRGGYWGDLPGFVRASRRIGLDPAARAPGNGFRVALPVSP
jgi:formylglycine-generating enzyme